MAMDVNYMKPHRRLQMMFLLVAVILASGCTQNGEIQTTLSTSGQNAVSIQNFAFNPSALTVKAGTAVTWINEDSVAHDVISDSGAFASESLATGKAYSHTFNDAGTFNYHCGIHPSMKAKIIVEQ